MTKLLFFIAFLYVTISSFGQGVTNKDLPLTRILFVLDGSQSMLAKWESGVKMNIAQDLLTDMVDSLSNIDNIEMALRVYGHQKPVPPQDCNDTKLEVPFSKNNSKKIIKKLYSIHPKGTTPIAYSLELSANDFPVCDECRNIIILITDGIESCEGDPCAVSTQLQKKGIILKPFVIGVGIIDDFKDDFECIGRYYNATNKDRFKEILEVVVSQALNTTTLQINLNDKFGKPTETNVNMTFYDNFTGKELYNFIHTINRKGNPDTLSLDPIPTYNIIVHTIPQTTKDSITITPGTHNTVKIDAPQGSLIVKTSSPQLYKDLKFIVTKKGSNKILHVQNINQEEKYLLGTYDLEILTLPRITIKNVKIEQRETNTIQIPEPGLVTLLGSAPVYGSIYKKEGNKLVWIHNLNSELIGQTLTMQPGKYRVISRAKNAKESVFTSDIKFNVVSGSSIKVILN